MEQNKGFWAHALTNDPLRSRVAACFLQQLALCTSLPTLKAFGGTSSSSPQQTGGGPTAAAHEPFGAEHHSNSSTKGAAVAKLSGASSASSLSGVTGSFKGASSNIWALNLHLPPPRLAGKGGSPTGRSASVSQQQQQPESATPATAARKQVSDINQAPLNSDTHVTPRTAPSQGLPIQTPRSEDLGVISSSHRQWRPLLQLAERVFGHGISVKVPLQNRGASAARACALGETWSAFLDAQGHVRLCGSGAQHGLNCRPDHRFVSIAWVGDFIALIDTKKDLYIARVSGSSSGLRGGHVLAAFVASEGQPQKLLENVIDVSGTAAGLLVLSGNGEVFFYAVQKPRQAPGGGIVPYRKSSQVLLSPQLDIFVLDSLTAMLHKCSIQQHHGRPNTPRAIVSLRVQVKALSAGHRFLCCVDSNGGLWVMGWNEVGQLGIKGTDHVRAFQVHEEMSRTAYLTDVSCGKRHSVVLSVDGVVYVAGSNKHGQIGVTLPTPSSAQPTPAGQPAPRPAANDPGFPIARRFTRVPLPSRCVAIAAGPNASMFALDTFRVIVCGNNEFGQLGLDACVSINPAQVPLPVAQHGVFSVAAVLEKTRLPYENNNNAGIGAPPAPTHQPKENTGCCSCGGAGGSADGKETTSSIEPTSGDHNDASRKQDDGCGCVVQ